MTRPIAVQTTAPNAQSSTAPAEREVNSTAQLTITARCFDGKRLTVTATAEQSVGDLKVALQADSGIHKAVQRLVFAGNTLKDSETVGSVLVNGSTIFMLALKAFPATLGPFRVENVPLRASDFELPPLGDDFDSQGSMWLMEQRAAARNGLRGRGLEFPLCGQFSPPHPVTLTDEEKAAISIPSAAASFVFSYPMVAFDAMAGGSDATRSFLSVGGYVYLDCNQRILHATTLMPSDKDSGGLQFQPARPWQASWTSALMRQGRFQRITIAALNDVGAHHFCWLRPGELVKGDDGQPCAEQPSVEHGGFAYLFHRDVFNATNEELALDRYFPIASGEAYVADEEADERTADSAEGVATFALVSNLQQLQDLVAEAAAHASRGESGPEELQARIMHLERQLDSVTKCVACLTEDKSTILMPCSHLCMCTQCAERVQVCPICRATVGTRQRAFQA